MIDELKNFVNDVINDQNYHWLAGDVNFKDHGGIWYKKEYGDPDNYEIAIVELVNMEDATGDTSKGKYLISEHCVDLDGVSLENVVDALSSSGWTLNDENLTLLMIVEALYQYGGYYNDHLFTNNYREGLAVFGLKNPKYGK